MVRPPRPEDEDRRRITRERKALIAERARHVNRIKGRLFAQGIRGGHGKLSRLRDWIAARMHELPPWKWNATPQGKAA